MKLSETIQHIHLCDRRTDGRTNRETDGRAI